MISKRSQTTPIKRKDNYYKSNQIGAWTKSQDTHIHMVFMT
jgi:hypothetical protein